MVRRAKPTALSYGEASQRKVRNPVLHGPPSIGNDLVDLNFPECLTEGRRRQWAVGYDSMLTAARSDIQPMMASIRAAIESSTPGPALASPASYLANELAKIASGVGQQVNARDSRILGSIAEDASAVTDLAAETAGHTTRL